MGEHSGLLIYKISQMLRQEDCQALQYIFQLPESCCSCRNSHLGSLIELERKGHFSRAKPETLQNILAMIDRRDLIEMASPKWSSIYCARKELRMQVESYYNSARRIEEILVEVRKDLATTITEESRAKPVHNKLSRRLDELCEAVRKHVAALGGLSTESVATSHELSGVPVLPIADTQPRLQEQVKRLQIPEPSAREIKKIPLLPSTRSKERKSSEGESTPLQHPHHSMKPQASAQEVKVQPKIPRQTIKPTPKKRTSSTFPQNNEEVKATVSTSCPESDNDHYYVINDLSDTSDHVPMIASRRSQSAKATLMPPQGSIPTPMRRTRSSSPLATSRQSNKQVSHSDYDYVLVEPSDVPMIASRRSQSAKATLMPPQRSKPMPIRRTRSLATSPQNNVETEMSDSDYDYVLVDPSDVSTIASRWSQSAPSHTHLSTALVTQQPPSHGTGTGKTHAPVPPAPVMKRQPKTTLMPPQRSIPMPMRRTRSSSPLATSRQNNKQVSHSDHDYANYSI